MGSAEFERYTISEIEHGIALPLKYGKRLSIEQMQLLQLKDGESFVLVVHFGAFLTDNVERLLQWSRSKGIRTMRQKIDYHSVRIWRVCDTQPEEDKNEKVP
jgi:hypothetical protein